MRILIFMLLISTLTGCEYIDNLMKDEPPASALLLAQCDAKEMNWSYCYQAASKTCPSGYEISNKLETPDANVLYDISPVTRSMYYMCK